MAEGADLDGPKLYVPAERERAPAPCPPAAITILVVEDDATVRELVSGILSRRGYQLMAMDSPRSALAWAEKARPGEFDLLLTEVSLPGMSGELLAELVRKDHPGLPVLFLSTHAHDAALSANTHRYEARPFTTDELVGWVQRCLCAAPMAPRSARRTN